MDTPKVKLQYTMSDLVPFVAAVIRDCAITNLQQEVEHLQHENKKIQKELDRRNTEMVRVTGPGGFPVYAERHIAYVTFDEDDEATDCELELSNSDGEHADPNLSACPHPSSIETCEIHFGDQEKFVLDDCVDSEEGGGEMSLFYWCGDIASFCAAVEVTIGCSVVDKASAQTLLPRNEDVLYVRFRRVCFKRDIFFED